MINVQLFLFPFHKISNSFVFAFMAETHECSKAEKEGIPI